MKKETTWSKIKQNKTKTEWKKQAILDSTEGSKRLRSFCKKPTCASYTFHRWHEQALGVVYVAATIDWCCITLRLLLR